MSKLSSRRCASAVCAAAPVVMGVSVWNQKALAAPPRYDHVVVVVEENHAESQIIGDTTDAPYINSLITPANGGENFTNFFALNHPSQPNYLQIFSGSNQGTTTDTPPATVFTTPNLAASLGSAGVSFTGYSESLPSVGFTGSSSTTVTGQNQYMRKHNPWVDWQSASPSGNELPASVNQPFTAFPSSANYASLPTVSFVVPNEQNDMHDGSISQGDTWLKNNLDSYNTWAKTHNSLLIVTWDEDDMTTTNKIPTIFSGADVAGGTNATDYNHNNLLRTLEDMYGAAPTGAAVSASEIALPEPASAGLLAVGACALLGMRSRRQRLR